MSIMLTCWSKDSILNAHGCDIFNIYSRHIMEYFCTLQFRCSVDVIVFDLHSFVSTFPWVAFYFIGQIKFSRLKIKFNVDLFYDFSLKDFLHFIYIYLTCFYPSIIALLIIFMYRLHVLFFLNLPIIMWSRLKLKEQNLRWRKNF